MMTCSSFSCYLVSKKLVTANNNKIACFQVVQIIFSFCSYVMREDILRNPKIIVDLVSFSIHLAPFG